LMSMRALDGLFAVATDGLAAPGAALTGATMLGGGFAAVDGAAVCASTGDASNRLSVERSCGKRIRVFLLHEQNRARAACECEQHAAKRSVSGYSRKRRASRRSGTGAVASQRDRIRGSRGPRGSDAVRDGLDRVIDESEPSWRIISVVALRLTPCLGPVLERLLAIDSENPERFVNCPKHPVRRPDALGRQRPRYQQQNKQGPKKRGGDPAGAQHALSFVTVRLFDTPDCGKSGSQSAPPSSGAEERCFQDALACGETMCGRTAGIGRVEGARKRPLRALGPHLAIPRCKETHPTSGVKHRRDRTARAGRVA
jgi:hypothetical protein